MIEVRQKQAKHSLKVLSQYQGEYYFEGIDVFAKNDSWGARYTLCFTQDKPKNLGISVGFRADHQELYMLKRFK